MIPCILMIATMISGPPDFKCVTIETCRHIEVQMWIGRTYTVTRKDDYGQPYTTTVKTVDCFSKETGRIAGSYR